MAVYLVREGREKEEEGEEGEEENSEKKGTDGVKIIWPRMHSSTKMTERKAKPAPIFRGSWSEYVLLLQRGLDFL